MKGGREPYRLSPSHDPTTPIGSWKKAWGKLTEKAGLSGLRFHDLRHNAITELLTNPTISVQTTNPVSKRMIDRYAYIQLDHKRKALEKAFKKGSVITDVIKGGPDHLLCNLLILLVGAWGGEPQTPTVSRWRSAPLIARNPLLQRRNKSMRLEKSL
jgi:hypothetical protein